MGDKFPLFSEEGVRGSYPTPPNLPFIKGEEINKVEFLFPFPIVLPSTTPFITRKLFLLRNPGSVFIWVSVTYRLFFSWGRLLF